MKQIIHRGLAALIDYCCILLYAGLLLGLAMLLQLQHVTLSPLTGQLLGLITLTIPVVGWFIIREKGPQKATPGKRIMGLIVVTDNQRKPAAGIILRNIIKFLPWEIAHTGLQWLFYYDRMHMLIPSWVMILLILPQVIMLVYMLGILLDKNRQSLYDRLSHTKVRYITGPA